MLGYKIAGYYDKTEREWKPCIVTLEIPEDATIVRPEIRPCKKLRCNKARVINIVDFEDRTIQIDEALSIYILGEALSMSVGICGRRSVPYFTDIFAFARGIPGGAYRPGEVVSPETFDTDATMECSSGIHFFLTEEDANDFYNDVVSLDGFRMNWAADILSRLTIYSQDGALRPTESGRF